MKNSILITVLLFFLVNVFAQKTELRASLNSGLYSYSGNSTNANTSFNYDDLTRSGYTNNPYGSKFGICYGFSLNLQRVTKRNFIFGLDLGYESLSSKVSINKISTDQYPATGHTYLTRNNLNFYPFIGYRIAINQVSLDIDGGFDYARILHSKEHGSVSSDNGINCTFNKNYSDIHFDLRPRIQVSANYHKIGLYAGYALGLSNFLNGFVGDADFEAYSRLIRFGMTYKIW